MAKVERFRIVEGAEEEVDEFEVSGEISIVDAAANKQRFLLVKSEDGEVEEEDNSEEEEEEEQDGDALVTVKNATGERVEWKGRYIEAILDLEQRGIVPHDEAAENIIQALQADRTG